MSNFVLHAARQNAGSGVWADSGALQGPDDNSHDARAALNSAGRAMLVALSGTGNFISATEGGTGGKWSAFNIVVYPGAIAIVAGMLSDDTGNVTMLYEAIGFSTSQALAVSGEMSDNTWGSPVVVSGNDSVSQIYFALAPSGVAVAAWLSFATPEIHAVVRFNATASWSNPATVSRPGSTEIGPEAAAINSAGDAIVVYSGYNANSVHTEYGVNYTP